MGVAPPPKDALARQSSHAPPSARRHELSDFLRGRRALVSPESVGLDAGGTRRTPGLRREEVAQLAGVGLSWYTWLEQGRDITPSASVLDALARVLRLSAGERSHLFALARVELPLPGGDYLREAPEDLAAIVESLVPNGAYLLGPRLDILAWNRIATELLGAPTAAPDGRLNLLWWLFTTDRPDVPTRAATRRAMLARFRAEHARRIGDPDFAVLIDALEAQSAEFRRLWRRHEVQTEALGTKVIDHPDHGPLTLLHLQSAPTSHPDLRLVQMVPGDDATRAALAQL